MNRAQILFNADGTPKLHPSAVAILRALAQENGRQRDIVARTGLSQATITRWCETLIARKLIHIHSYQTNTPGGGPLRPVYAAGKAAVGHRAKKPTIYTAPGVRQRRYRARLKREGLEEPFIINRRARRALARAPKRDSLTTALFGAFAGAKNDQ